MLMKKSTMAMRRFACAIAVIVVMLLADEKPHALHRHGSWPFAQAVDVEASTTKQVPTRISSANDYKCSIYSFMPFTTINTNNNTKVAAKPFFNAQGEDNPGYNQLVSSVIATRAFNERDSSLVPELILYHDCPVKFDTNNSRAIDTGTVGHAAAQALVSSGRDFPCGLVGPYNDGPALELQSIATSAQIPQVVSRAYNEGVASQEKGPFTSMVMPDVYASLDVLMSFLEHWNRTDFISLVHSLTESGIQRREIFTLALDQDGLSTKQDTKPREKLSWNAFGYSSGVKTREVVDALREVKESGYRTIVVAMSNALSGEMEEIADAAELLGMNNRNAIENGETEYFWIFWGDLEPDNLFDTTDNVNQLLGGSTWFFPAISEDTTFEQRWRGYGSGKTAALDIINEANRNNPIQDPNEPGYFMGDENYFATNQPELGVSLLFDATISLGMGGCLAYYEEANLMPQFEQRVEEYTNYISDFFLNNHTGDPTEPWPTEEEYRAGLSPEFFTPLTPIPANPAGNDDLSVQVNVPSLLHAQKVRDARFYGASGYVSYQKSTSLAQASNATNSNQDTDVRVSQTSNGHVRDHENFPWLVINLLPSEILQSVSIERDTDSSIPVEYATTHMYFPARERGAWTWIEFQPYTYADGTSNQPKLLRTVPEQNYLSDGPRIAGFALAGMVYATAVGSAIWVFVYRSHKVVRASQPLFLYMLFFGASLVATGAITMGFDENRGVGQDTLSNLCVAMPWLVSSGFIIIYGALFAKLWRVNRVLSFTRRKIDVRHVAWPIAVLMTAAFAILTAWTIADPLTWERDIVNQSTGESHGDCTCDHPVDYASALVAVILVPVGLTGFMAWKTKDVDNAYSEAYWIFVLIFAHMEIILVSIPVFVILEDVSTDGTYVGLSSMLTLTADASIFLVMLPKLIAMYWDDKRPSNARSNLGGGQVHITGLNPSSGPTGSCGAHSSSLLSRVAADSNKYQPTSSNNSSLPARHSAGTRTSVNSGTSLTNSAMGDDDKAIVTAPEIAVTDKMELPAAPEYGGINGQVPGSPIDSPAGHASTINPMGEVVHLLPA